MKKFELTILPVAKGTFKGLKVSVADVARKFRTGQLTIMKRTNPDLTETNVFVLGKISRPLVGKYLFVGNAKNLRPYGTHRILGVVNFKMKQGMLQIEGADIGTSVYSDLCDLEAVVFEIMA